jgi:hypothetical protein
MTREDELIERIRRGDSIADVRKWFLGTVAETMPSDGDLSAFERMFLDATFLAYQAWKREQEERANNPAKLH